MARIRSIKPDFFTSEDVVRLSPLARLLYIATWMEADREGRLAWRPVTMKLRYLPGDSCTIEDLAAELVDAGLVVPYEADGQRLAHIPTFTKHQIINNREAPSTLPAPPDACGTRAPRVNDACGTRERASRTRLVGREGKGKEGKGEDASPRVDASPTRPKAATKTRVASDFAISDRVREWAAEKGFGDLDQHLEAFKAKAGAKGYTYADWDLAFMGAIREDWAKLRGPGAGGSGRSVLNADEVLP